MKSPSSVEESSDLDEFPTFPSVSIILSMAFKLHVKWPTYIVGGG